MATRKPKSGVSGATYEPGRGTRVTPGPRSAPFPTPRNPTRLPKGTMYSDELESSQGFKRGGAKRAGRGLMNPDIRKHQRLQDPGTGVKREQPWNRPGTNPRDSSMWAQLADEKYSSQNPKYGDQGDYTGEAADNLNKTLGGPDSPNLASKMTYDRFVDLHGGKSTANLAGKFRQRFGGNVTDDMAWAMEDAAQRRDAARKKRGLGDNNKGLAY